MGDSGLTPVDDPGKLLLGDRLTGVPGGTVLPAMQGTRPLLVELQALVTPMASRPIEAGGGGPRRRPIWS